VTQATEPNLILLIGKMDGKLDTLLIRHDAHERRIGTLEAFQNKAIGWAAAVSAAVAAAADFLLPLLKGQ
jgi:hypothetical protein